MICQWCLEERHSGACDREVLKRQIKELRREAAAADAYIYNFAIEMLKQLESTATAMTESFRRFREVWITPEVPVAEGKPS
jgi:hypothetical protein